MRVSGLPTGPPFWVHPVVAPSPGSVRSPEAQDDPEYGPESVEMRQIPSDGKEMGEHDYPSSFIARCKTLTLNPYWWAAFR